MHLRRRILHSGEASAPRLRRSLGGFVAALVVVAGSPAGAEQVPQRQAPAADCRLRSPNAYYPTGFDTHWGHRLRPEGTLTARVLLVDFEDAPGTSPPEEVLAEVSQAQAFFQSASYGRVSVEFVGAEKWFRIPARVSEYDTDSTDVFLDAIAAADPEVDFSGTDTVVLVRPDNVGRQQYAATSPFPHPTPDGTEIRHFALVTDPPWQVVAHEIAHHFGLPDIYLDPVLQDERGTQGAVGTWDIMGGADGSAEDFFAWHKWKMGWLEDDQVVCISRSGVYEQVLDPVEVAGGVKAVVVRTSGYGAYFVENRQSMGADEGLCEEGPLVYEVDSEGRIAGSSIEIRTLEAESPPSSRCGRWWNAPLDLAGGSPVFADEEEGLRIELVGTEGDSTRVRVSLETTGAATALGFRFRSHYVASGRVTSPDHRPCIQGARVRITRPEYDDGRFDYVTVARARTDESGRYRVRVRHEHPPDYVNFVALLDDRVIDGIDCFNAMGPPRWHRHE